MTADQRATAHDRFREIYHSMYDDLFRYLVRRVGRVEDADDLARSGIHPDRAGGRGASGAKDR